MYLDQRQNAVILLKPHFPFQGVRFGVDRKACDGRFYANLKKHCDDLPSSKDKNFCEVRYFSIGYSYSVNKKNVSSYFSSRFYGQNYLINTTMDLSLLVIETEDKKIG